MSDNSYAEIIFKKFAKGKQCENRTPDHPKGVWKINIENFHEDLKIINPMMYFVTSGEAVQKTSVLCDDLSKALAVAKRLQMILKALKGDAQYLETQWEDSILLVKKKYTRPTSRINVKKALEAKANEIVCSCGKICSSKSGYALHKKRCLGEVK